MDPLQDLDENPDSIDMDVKEVQQAIPKAKGSQRFIEILSDI